MIEINHIWVVYVYVMLKQVLIAIKCVSNRRSIAHGCKTLDESVHHRTPTPNVSVCVCAIAIER